MEGGSAKRISARTARNVDSLPVAPNLRLCAAHGTKVAEGLEPVMRRRGVLDAQASGLPGRDRPSQVIGRFAISDGSTSLKGTSIAERILAIQAEASQSFGGQFCAEVNCPYLSSLRIASTTRRAPTMGLFKLIVAGSSTRKVTDWASTC